MISPRLAAWGDRVCLAAFVLTLFVEFLGGVRLGDGPYRFSMTSAWRLAAYALILVAVRHLVVPHPSLRERLTARRRARSSAAWPGERLWLPTRREWIAAIALLSVATAWILREQIRMLNGVPDLGDPLFSMWRLSTVAHQLANSPWHLFDGSMFYPASHTLAYSDAMLLPGLITAPFLWAGVPVAIAYNALVVLSFLAAGLAMFFAVRTLTGQFTPAIVAAVLFAFYPYRFSGYSHLEKLGTFFMPVAFVLLWRVLRHGRRNEALALGVTLAAQTLWSLYLGCFLAIGLAAVTVARWAAGHFTWRERARSLLLASAVLGIIVIPYTLPYWAARSTVGERPRWAVSTFSAQPSDLLAVTAANRLYGGRLPPGASDERHLFPGLTAIGLGAVALAPPLSPLAAAAAVGVLASVDGAFGTNGVTVSWLYDVLPPFRAFRAAGRFSAVVGLFVCLLAGLGVARVMAWRGWRGRRPPWMRHVVGVGFIAVAFFELQVNLKLIPVPLEAPAIYGALPGDGSAVLVDLPVPEPYNSWDFQYIYHSTFHHRRVLNGTSGFIPEDYPEIVEASGVFPDGASVDTLRRRGADLVVIHGDFYSPADFARIVTALEARPDAPLIAARPSPAGREDRLYRLR